GDGDDADTLLRHAGGARQRVADQGGNGVQSYTPQLGQRAQERAALERALYRALENDEFELHYQPQLSLETGNVTGVEALLRWRHPELGLLGPGHFLEVAEDTGQIVPIGAWVLRTACAQAAAWHQAGHWPTVCVNISARQMQLSMLGRTVQQALDACGLDPAYLELELTERALVADGDLDATIAVLRQLKQLGVCLALDNVGSGFTSLSYLTNFPIDVIKIDRSAVAAVPERAGAASMVLAVIALARALGQKTVAAGVETLAQLDFLDRSGCDAMQGQYFSPPLPAAGLTSLLEQIGRDYRARLRDIAASTRKRAG
ncbi:MAG: putative bifunctional diguanylate cyclase/phosphodiesterase, partial [Sphingomonadaceae bacterium]